MEVQVLSLAVFLNGKLRPRESLRKTLYAERIFTDVKIPCREGLRKTFYDMAPCCAARRGTSSSSRTVPAHWRKGEFKENSHAERIFTDVKIPCREGLRKTFYGMAPCCAEGEEYSDGARITVYGAAIFLNQLSRVIPAGFRRESRAKGLR